MGRLDPAKLHVTFVPPAGSDPLPRLTLPRRYTLTHSDATGDLFLTIGPEYDRRALAGLQTRFMRDEVLAEWLRGTAGPELHAYCHVSGGLVLGGAAMRDGIFRRELPLVFEAMRYGDRRLFAAQAELDRAPLMVHFRSHLRQYDRVERWGAPGDYRLPE